MQRKTEEREMGKTKYNIFSFFSSHNIFSSSYCFDGSSPSSPLSLSGSSDAVAGVNGKRKLPSEPVGSTSRPCAAARLMCG